MSFSKFSLKDGGEAGMEFNGGNLEEVLEAHQRWIARSDGWTEDDRANLRGADLRGFDLSGACLIDADLRGTCMDGVCLKGANLYCANLIEAYLVDADLRCANLKCADLRGANMNEADLRFAEFEGADMNGVDLDDANIRCAGLSGAKNIPFIPMACPDAGAFIGWKKCIAYRNNNERLIVKLLIPEDAERSSATGRTCRADKAVVLEIQNFDGSKSKFDTVYSIYTIYNIDKPLFAYQIGKTVVPDGFDKNRWKECASGIHFFINRQEAVDY